MDTLMSVSWTEANQRYLNAALDRVRAALALYIGQTPDGHQDAAKSSDADMAMPAPAALDVICMAFGLSSFERDVLLLCAGVELDSGFAYLCARANGDSARVQPTFSTTLSVLPDAHWSALTPAAPLRFWRLISLDNANTPLRSALQIDERILHYLMGVDYIDDRLAGLVQPLDSVADPVGAHQALAERLDSLWSGDPNGWPIVQLSGSAESSSKRQVAARFCAAAGMSPYVLSSQVIPLDPREMDGLIRLWAREAALSRVALILDCDEDEHGGETAREKAILRLIENLHSPLMVIGRTRLRSSLRTMVTFDVQKPSSPEQRRLWRALLDDAPQPVNGKVDQLVAQFNLDVSSMVAVRSSLIGQPEVEHQLWDACRAQARPRLDDLAQRIETAATWDDIVLPDQQFQTLRSIVTQVRRRTKVYETWGFAARSSRGLGISALFAGASGTGKTLAAEILASELRLDLYRIDLSSVVSKYIGETEKNLRRVFDAAEEGGAILLFDEADALFGKRSEVKDSHDRYANIEVSYLLQRVESYQGLAILTTNMKSALDSAFLRRIRFVVPFPFPDAQQRARIWSQVFPAQTPTAGLDPLRLSQLNVAGGNIRNIALNAAFLAADAGEPVQMPHLLAAARSEYIKLEKTLTESEIRGWLES